MAQIIGIDFGTTNSVVAVMQGDKPVVIKNKEGQHTTPSLVGFSADGKRKVGNEAKRQVSENANRTVLSIKRFVGLRYSEMVRENIKATPYKVRSSETDLILLNIEGYEYTPQEIAATILKKIKKTAEAFLEEEVTEAVITVPAYFNDTQRRAIKEACKIAGLEVRRIIGEPMAAALAYGIDKTSECETIAVYRLGGGTCDVSILELNNGFFETKATGGDTHLGGDDVDYAIVDYLLEIFSKQEKVYPSIPSIDSNTEQRLKIAAEKAKIELSTKTVTEVNIPNIATINGVSKNLVLKITRTEFEQLIEGWVQRTLNLCRNALKQANLNSNDLSKVILVGGSTHIPKVQQAVAQFFGKSPVSFNTGEVAALGAAIQAGVLNGDFEEGTLVVMDATSTDVKGVINGDFKTTFIKANIPVPTLQSVTFSTSSDNQSFLEFSVVQGNAQNLKSEHFIGTFNIHRILPQERGVPKIDVTVTVNTDGIVEVDAKENGRYYATKKLKCLTLSDFEIEKMKAQLQGIEVQ